MAIKKPAAKPAPKRKPAAKAAATKPAVKTAGRPSSETKLQRLTPELVNKTPKGMADHEAAARKLEAEHGKHLATIDEKFGDQLPYDPRRLENEVRFYLNESASSMLEAGARLVVLREHEEPGNFHKSLERIGIAPRAAQKLMQAAVKFAGPKAQLATRLDKTKLLELVSEDDEELKALAEGGTLKGMSLDEIDSMPASQLRAELRKSRTKVSEGEEIHERLLASKDDKINKLERELKERERRVSNWEGAFREIASNLHSLGGQVMHGVIGLRNQVDEISKEMVKAEIEDNEVAFIAIAFNEQLKKLEEHFADARAQFELNLAGYLPTLEGTMLLQMKAEKLAAE